MINLKELYGQKYRIGYDGTVQAYPELKSDPDYQIILCRFGEIYAFSSDYLAVWVKGGKRIERMKREIAGLIVHNDGEGEAVFLFKPQLLDKVGEYVKARKRRKFSAESKTKLIRQTEATRFRPQIRSKSAVQAPQSDELL